MRIRYWPQALGLLACLPSAAIAQDAARMTGRVVSDAGAPVPTATVLITTYNIGTVTNNDGTYTLSVPAARLVAGGNVEIHVRRIGFLPVTRTTTLKLGDVTTINFQLQAAAAQLQAVVSTGIGQSTTRERLGTSIATISAAEVTAVVQPNIVNALAAKAPGVDITSSSGAAGASSYIRIRGVNTINGSGQPLFVIDGVPINNDALNPNTPSSGAAFTGGTDATNRASDINPNDIESVNILMGPAAAAVYGARAANGVVLIQTKSGQAGRTRTTISSAMTVDQVTKEYPLQRSFGQGSAGAFNPATPGAFVRSWGPALAAGTPTFSHFGEMFHDGHTNDTNISFSGGQDKTTFYLSLGRLAQNGVIVGPNNFFDRTSARLKGTRQIADWLTVNGNVAYSQVNADYVQKGSNVSGLMLGALRTPPNFDNTKYLTDPTAAFVNGLHRSYRDPNPRSRTESRGFDNPFFVINDMKNTSNVGRTIGDVGATLQPTDWLKIDYRLGNDYSNDQRLNVFPPSNSTAPTGQLTSAHYVYQELNQDATATASHVFSSAINESLTLGYNRNSRSFQQNWVDGFNWIDPTLQTLNNTIQQIPNDYRYLKHSESYYGQETVNIAEQLFLTGALRNDGFSSFGVSSRRHWFPKASGAWEFTKLYKPAFASSWFDSGKLRAAWGEAGNEPDVYGTLSAYTFANVFDGGWGTALSPIYNGNGGLLRAPSKGQPNLGPERTSSFEGGIDLSFLNQRVGVGFTSYNSLTRDAIFTVPLASSTGYGVQLANAGTIRNKGVEVTLDVAAVQAKQFAWRFGAQFAKNDNRLVNLGNTGLQFVPMPGNSQDPGGGAAVVGSRVGVYLGTDWVRCGAQGIAAAYEQYCAQAGAPKGAVYIDSTGQPVTDPTQRVIADPFPDWTAGIHSTFTLFSRFQLSTLLDIKHGGQMLNGTRGALYSYGTHQDTEDRGQSITFADRYGATVTGPGAAKPILMGEAWYGGKGGSFGSGAGSQFVEDAGFVKLREIGLTYNAPVRFAEMIGMSAMDLRIAGRNLHTWTRYTGLDPESSTLGATNLRGYDYFGTPQTRSWVFSVNLTR